MSVSLDGALTGLAVFFVWAISLYFISPRKSLRDKSIKRDDKSTASVEIGFD